MPSTDPGIEAIMRKRAGLPVEEPTPEPWQPATKRESDYHREVARRTSAEQQLRATDAQLVARIALDHLRNEFSGYDFDSKEVFKVLRTVLDEGGQMALNHVTDNLGQAFDEPEIETLWQHANTQQVYAAQQQADEQERALAEYEQEAQALDQHVVQQHEALLRRPGVAEATDEVLARLEGGPGHPHQSDSLDDREEKWRGAITLGKDLAEHRAIQAKKYAIMDSVPRLIGEDQSQLSKNEARDLSLRKLGIIDDQGYLSDEGWDPTKNTRYVKPTPDEIKAEHDQRRWELREALDHPNGYPDGHPLADDPPERDEYFD